MTQIQPVLNNDRKAWEAAKAKREREKLLTSLNKRVNDLETIVANLQTTIDRLTKE